MNNHRYKVVILDDSEICRATAKLMLEEQGFVVIPLSSPLKFGVTLRSEQPDIALLDVGMPALQGNQTVSLANRYGLAKLCPLVLFSDRPAAELATLVKQCGADGYISKSSDWTTIGESLLRFIRARPAST